MMKATTHRMRTTARETESPRMWCPWKWPLRMAVMKNSVHRSGFQNDHRGDEAHAHRHVDQPPKLVTDWADSPSENRMAPRPSRRRPSGSIRGWCCREEHHERGYIQNQVRGHGQKFREEKKGQEIDQELHPEECPNGHRRGLHDPEGILHADRRKQIVPRRQRTKATSPIFRKDNRFWR
jgi:hypothetical protein